MTGEKIGKARTALSRFINSSHPNDEYFLIAFNSRAQLLLDRTRDGEAVLQKLTLVTPRQNTALYDAVYLGIERVTRGAHQKKALLIISDGQDNNSRYNFNEVRRLMKESTSSPTPSAFSTAVTQGASLECKARHFWTSLPR